MTIPYYREELLEALRALVARKRGVREAKMIGLPAFYAGGKLFACVWRQGIGLRLPDERASKLVDRGVAGPFRPYGRKALRDWVELRPESADAVADHRTLIDAAIRHAKSAVQ